MAFTFIMQNIASNLGGMITPIGNPQNLYIFSFYDIILQKRDYEAQIIFYDTTATTINISSKNKIYLNEIVVVGK